MSNQEIIQFAFDFRKELIGDRAGDLMCWIVTHPLSLKLKEEFGIDNEILNIEVEVMRMSNEEEYKNEFGLMEHFCIKIGNKILDATADQFKGMDKVYFGSRPIWYLDPM